MSKPLFGLPFFRNPVFSLAKSSKTLVLFSYHIIWHFSVIIFLDVSCVCLDGHSLLGILLLWFLRSFFILILFLENSVPNAGSSSSASLYTRHFLRFFSSVFSAHLESLGYEVLSSLQLLSASCLSVAQALPGQQVHVLNCLLRPLGLPLIWQH